MAKASAASRARAKRLFAARFKGKSDKNTGTYKGKSLALGGGGRFQRMVDALEGEGMSEDRAKRITAARGRQKLGKSRFQGLAAAGRRRAAAARY